MNNKNSIAQFIYALILIAYIFISDHFLLILDNQVRRTYILSPLVIVSAVLFVILGILLGLDCFLKELKKMVDGK